MPNVKDTAQALETSEQNVRNQIKSGKIKAEKVSGKFFISTEEFERLKSLPKRQNQRTTTSKNKINLHDSKISVLKLKDDGITRFWDNKCDELSEQLPLASTGEKHFIKNSGTNISNYKLQQKENKIQITEMDAEPCMEYAISDIKCKVLRIYPKKKLKDLWLNWMTIAKEIYNTTVEYLKKEKFNKLKIDKYKIRDHIKTIKNYNIPNTSLEYSVFEAINAYKMSDNPKERTTNCISLDGRSIKNGYIYILALKNHLKSLYKNKHKTILKNLQIKELLGLEFKQICKLSYNANMDKMYFIHTIDLKKKQIPKKQFVSLDPGIRSFMTYFDGDSYGEIGSGFAKGFKRRIKRIDELQTKIDNTRSSKKKKQFKRAQNRIREKLTNKTKDLHYKTINFLGNYEYVFLPTFKVKDIAKNLDKRNTRSLMFLSHFSFKMRLANKTSEFGNKVIICNEAYTSKTCTKCGKENNELGSSKVFECKNCGIVHDRDYNGARNIALRVLTHGLK